MLSPEMVEEIARKIATEVVTRIGFRVEVVEALPETGQNGILYLVAKEDSEEGDVYDEYVWIYSSSSYEHLGTTQVDLSDYPKKNDDETITGQWTFENLLESSPLNDYKWTFGRSGYNFVLERYNGSTLTQRWTFTNSSII